MRSTWRFRLVSFACLALCLAFDLAAAAPDSSLRDAPIQGDSVTYLDGEWTATWTEPDGPLEIGGTYQAQWRLIDGRWLIQGELYVPTRCIGGAYCERHP